MTDINDAANSLENFADTDFEAVSERAAQTFETAGRRIEQALVRAAITGELSFHDMAEAILRDLARIAVQQLITDPLQTVLGTAGGSPQQGGFSAPININLSGVTDAASFTQSQGQISAALARGLSSASRYL